MHTAAHLRLDSGVERRGVAVASKQAAQCTQPIQFDKSRHPDTYHGYQCIALPPMSLPLPLAILSMYDWCCTRQVTAAYPPCTTVLYSKTYCRRIEKLLNQPPCFFLLCFIAAVDVVVVRCRCAAVAAAAAAAALVAECMSVKYSAKLQTSGQAVRQASKQTGGQAKASRQVNCQQTVL